MSMRAVPKVCADTLIRFNECSARAVAPLASFDLVVSLGCHLLTEFLRAVGSYFRAFLRFSTLLAETVTAFAASSFNSTSRTTHASLSLLSVSTDARTKTGTWIGSLLFTPTRFAASGVSNVSRSFKLNIAFIFFLLLCYSSLFFLHVRIRRWNRIRRFGLSPLFPLFFDLRFHRIRVRDA